MGSSKEVGYDTLRNWLEEGKEVSIVDVRPIQERSDWFIPGSVYVNAYDKLKAHKANALHGLHLDKKIPVVTVCAAGKTSAIAAGQLNELGYEVYSLQGGMKAWSLAWNTAKLSFPGFQIIQFRRTGKGCLSYMIASDNEAVIVDASLAIETYQQVLEKERLNLKYVIETHLHADHLSRSKQLAENNNAPLYLPVPNKVSFNFIPVIDNITIEVGNISMKALATPGHTPESTCYLIGDRVLLTGDTLFIDGVGRPDLKAGNEETIQKTRNLYRSLQKLLALDENLIVLPAHAGQPIDFDRIPIQATIGHIKKSVSMLKLNEEEFINTILQRIPPTPANFLSIVERNVKGDFSDMNAADLEAGANRCAIS